MTMLIETNTVAVYTIAVLLSIHKEIHELSVYLTGNMQVLIVGSPLHRFY